MSSPTTTLHRSIGGAGTTILDYFELMKPELTILSVLSTLCGFYLGTVGPVNVPLFIHTAIGTLLLGGGAGALNQYIERQYDALMKRTERRPLPSGRLTPPAALFFGILLAAVGTAELAIFANLLTAFLGAVTFSTYIFLYTPLKRVTSFSTIVGAVPGALPPMIGWTAARNAITVEAWVLFAILFCWQIPHFLSLAWMYRKDYARAGFRMLTVFDDNGRKTGNQIVFFTVILIPATLLCSYFGLTGPAYTVAATALGTMFLAIGWLLLRSTRALNDPGQLRVNYYARRMFFASLLYLPLLMIVMSMDKV